MSKQKDKGKAFESKVARFIHASLYEYVEEYKTLFDSLGNVNLQPRREKSSGTCKDSDNDVDLGLGLKWFPFSVECKHNAGVNKISLNAILNNDVAFLHRTMKQANRHATSKKLIPLIFFRGNFTMDMAAFNKDQIAVDWASVPYVILANLVVMSAENFMALYFKKP